MNIFGEKKDITKTHPEAIRWLIIVKIITETKNEWKKKYNEDEFYIKSMKEIRKYSNISDEELKKEFPQMTLRV